MLRAGYQCFRTAPLASSAASSFSSRKILAPSVGLMILGSVSFSSSSVAKMAKIEKTESEWKELLKPEEYYVIRQKGTERPGTGEYNKFYPKEGFFACRACGAPLYSAASKFNSGCGWPAFDKCYEGAVKTEIDVSHGMRRIEIMCNSCGGHLGHVFEGEKFTPTNERHCVNSLSVKYEKGQEAVEGLTEKKVV